MTNPDSITVKTAYELGALVAKNYKVGDKFLGAFGEAEKFGYGPGSFERSIFTTGYLNHLASTVVTTEDLTLIQYGA